MKRTHRGVALLGVVAPSGTGKTTLLEAVIPELVRAGLRVGCVKHTHHAFDIDKPGKDSHRLRQAGATQMLLGSSARWALMVETPDAPDAGLVAMLDRLDLESLDLVLVEGFRPEALPRILVDRAGTRDERLSADGVIAVATNRRPPPAADVPVLDLDRPATVAAFVLDYLESLSGE